jgi:hypothetical protein
MVSLDWVKMGWGAEMSPEFNPDLPLTLDFSNCKENDLLPYQAALNSVHRIAEQYPQPYTLMVSGGVDSQAMIYAWLHSGIPFTVVSVRYLDREGQAFNQDDLAQLDEYAERHEFDVKYLDFNLLDFVENELEDYVIKHQCTSPQICTHMKMSEMVPEGTVLFSGNNFYNTPMLNYTIMGLHRYAVNTGRPLIPFFLIHDPELVGAWQKYNCSLNMDHINDNYHQKCFMYRMGGFDIIPQDQKQTGFERVKDYYDMFPDLITKRDRLEFSHFPSKRIFDVRYRYYFTRKVKYKESIVVGNLPVK